MMRKPRLVRALASLAMLVPVALLGRSASGYAAGGSPLPAVVSGASTAPQRVIIVLKNQHPELQAGFEARVRADTLRREQAPLLAEVTRARATHVMPYTLINAVAATVSSAAISRLRSNANVAAVVPDRALIVTPTSVRERHPTSGARQAASHGYICPSTPTLEPEGLALTNTLNVPGSITGAGVKVAYLWDGLSTDIPDFIRANGQHVIVDYQDFSGDGAAAPTYGLEGFGDAATIAAQGRQLYDAHSYAATQQAGACPIRIRGVAPGVSLLALKIDGSQGTTESMAIQAIQYAVAHGANVISQSFAFAQYPAQSTDPLTMAEDAAVSAGVTMVASSNDGGPANTVSASPASDPSVISVGATTQFRLFAETGRDGFSLSNGQWLSNNIAAISGGGFTPTGLRSVDVVAPGETGWIPCVADTTLFTACTDAAGNPSALISFQGTSEAAPFVAGEAALVIQAYRQTHGGHSPTPAVIKQLITGTADDLGIPSDLQGAGLMDSARAVQAAMSYRDSNGKPAAKGMALISSPSVLTKTDAPGTAETFPITVTNVSAVTETVKPSVRTLGAPLSSASFPLTLNASTAHTFTNQDGTSKAYIEKTFTVPVNAQQLKATISWDIASQPGKLVRLVLLDPQKRFVNYSDPFGATGYGRADVRNPAAGAWTAVLWTESGSSGYTGSVQLAVTSSPFIPATLTMPPGSVQIPPGQSRAVSIAIKTPATSGDFNADVVLTGTASGHPAVTGVVPLFLRSLVSLGQNGGTFGGTLTGGDGQSVLIPTSSYQFDVLSGLHDLDLGVTLADSNHNVGGLLIDPNGTPVESLSTITTFDPQTFQPTAFTNTMQFFRRDPTAGRWTFILLLTSTLSGVQNTVTFTGTLATNGVSVQAPSLPASQNTTLIAGQQITIPITITNTGNTTKSFFPDARLPSTTRYCFYNDLCAEDGTLPSMFSSVISVPVPPETTDLTDIATSQDGPIDLDMQYFAGGRPRGKAGQPNLSAVSQRDQSTGIYTATVDYQVPEVPTGYYLTTVSEPGPFGPNAGPTRRVQIKTFVTTRTWDLDIDSSTGDVWKSLYPGSNTPFAPLTLAPGAQGTIHLTITPGQNSGETAGTVVQGTVFIDTLSLSNGADVNNFSGDELVALPYKYTVG